MEYIATLISILAVTVSLAAWRDNHQKLRLDLYERRFEIYSATLTFFHELMDSRPAGRGEGQAFSERSPTLVQAQRRFIRATREAQFLFKESSGIQKLLEGIHTDSIRVISSRQGDLLPLISAEAITFHKETIAASNKIIAAIPELERKLKKYLDFSRIG